MKYLTLFITSLIFIVIFLNKHIEIIKNVVNTSQCYTILIMHFQCVTRKTITYNYVNSSALIYADNI